jgi:hypothetical protein
MDPTLVPEDPGLTDNLEKVDWVGAKLGGYIQLRGACQVSFACQIHDKRIYKTFKCSEYGGKEQACAAAEEYQRMVCYQQGRTRNNYGFYTNSDGKEIGIVKLTRGKFMLFSKEHLPLVLAHTWWAQPDHNNWYAATKIKHGEGRRMVQFHSLVLPEAKMVDHIDHNGLNNTITNLRPTNNQLNLFNSRRSKANTSGHKGISLIIKKDKEHRGLRYWQASVMIHGKSIGKQFSVNVLGEEGAKNAAKAHRDQLFEKYGIFKG